MKTFIATIALASVVMFSVVTPTVAAGKTCTFFTVKGDKVKCFTGWKAFWFRNNHDSD